MQLKRTNLNDKITDTIDDFNDNWGTLEQELDERYTKTESDTRFAPKQHTHEISDVTGLSEELESSGLTLVNLIENGDFSDGREHWGINTPIENNMLKIEGNNIYNYVPIPNWVGDVVYVASKLEVKTKSGMTNYGIRISNTQTLLSVSKLDLGLQKTTNVTKITDDKGVNFNCRAGNSYDVHWWLVINLTQTFGAGNEPTKEEMDLLIETLGVEYFEEITVTKLQAINWLLKLIRQNALATTSLGGTIL